MARPASSSAARSYKRNRDLTHCDDKQLGHMYNLPFEAALVQWARGNRHNCTLDSGARGPTEISGPSGHGSPISHRKALSELNPSRSDDQNGLTLQNGDCIRQPGNRRRSARI